MTKTKKLIEDFDTVCQCARAWLVENGKDDLWIDSHSTKIKGIVEKFAILQEYNTKTEEKLESLIKQREKLKEQQAPPDNDSVEKIISKWFDRIMADFCEAKIRTLLWTDLQKFSEELRKFLQDKQPTSVCFSCKHDSVSMQSTCGAGVARMDTLITECKYHELKPSTEDDLVEKIFNIGMATMELVDQAPKWLDVSKEKDKAKAEIRKLLQESK